MAEFEEQKHCSAEEVKRIRNSELQEHRKFVETLKAQMEQEKSNSQNEMDELRRKYNQDMQNLRDRLLIEKEQWQDQFMAKQELEQENKFVGTSMH
jgi:ElaB/YqjD/DUF883 family membrane-anchored ribosome-binding protein